ncbi:hypothetical protein DESC_590117 [Desulfosarcina cetonica]|nr:hypothetical protein DESC_590117 [Desulfosarcina cetonica]
MGADVAQWQGDAHARCYVATGGYQAGKLVTQTAIAHQRRLNFPDPAVTLPIDLTKRFKDPPEGCRIHGKPRVLVGTALGGNDFEIGRDALIAQPTPQMGQFRKIGAADDGADGQKGLVRRIARRFQTLQGGGDEAGGALAAGQTILQGRVEGVHLQDHPDPAGVKPSGKVGADAAAVGEHLHRHAETQNKIDHLPNPGIDTGLTAENDDAPGAQIPGLDQDVANLLRGQLRIQLPLGRNVAIRAAKIAAQAEFDLHG